MITRTITSLRGRPLRCLVAAAAFMVASADLGLPEDGAADVLSIRTAHAEPTIVKNPGDHPNYSFEAEPHALLGFGGPFEGSQGHFGAGFRGTVVIVQNGFVSSINNSIGITFGADLFTESTLFLPVGMQWNFWIWRHWSFFGEPGLGIAIHEGHNYPFHPILMAGARYHFSDKVTLTMRVGYPSVAIGVSFFL